MNIDRNNYETYFLNYLDEELKPADRRAVEKFLDDNADLQKEFVILQQTILKPTEIVFDQKELLFREEKQRRIVPFYRARVAAAVAVLIAGSWVVKTVILKNRASEITGNGPTAVAKIVTQTSHKAVSENNGYPAGQETKKIIADNKNPGKMIKEYKSVKKDQASQGDQQIPQKKPDQQNLQTNPETEDVLVAVRKSNASAELQSNGTGNDPKQIPALSGSRSPALSLAAPNSMAALNNESILLNDSDTQTDDAISVVALNDRNKSITGLFKKLTKRTPADDNSRKVRVSVFQINY